MRDSQRTGYAENKSIIDQDLMALWWMHVWSIHFFFFFFYSISFFFMCGVWQPSGSLTGFPSCFDKGRITSRPCIHPPDTQTWREPERSDCRPSRHRWHLGYSIFTGIFSGHHFCLFFFFRLWIPSLFPWWWLNSHYSSKCLQSFEFFPPLPLWIRFFFFAFPCCVQRMHIIYSSKWMSWKTQVTRYTSVCLIFSVAKVMTGSVFGFGCCRSFFSVLSCLYGSLSSGLLLLLGCHFSTY